jgi:hypothetical protein
MSIYLRRNFENEIMFSLTKNVISMSITEDFSMKYYIVSPSGNLTAIVIDN